MNREREDYDRWLAGRRACRPVRAHELASSDARIDRNEDILGRLIRSLAGREVGGGV